MGLHDRDYMYGAPDGGGRSSGMTMLWWLIGINAAAFLLTTASGNGLYQKLALHGIGKGFHTFQLLTAGFLHYDFMHILFNMYGLYIFGKLVVPHLGGRFFLALYLVGVLCGNLLFLALNLHRGVLLVGASGAVCAVIMAAAMLEPDQRFLMLFMPFSPIKTSTLIVCYTILEILMALTSAHSRVAHLAHLGGFIGGYLVTKLIFRGNVTWDPLRRKVGNRWQSSAREPRHTASYSSSPVSRDELDALLDKISRSGINSLSAEELSRLKQAREEMRR